MSKNTYSEKLKDPRWQKKRLEIFQRDEWSCCYCGNNELTLHVHHLAYSKEPWDVPNEHLLTLCEECHEAEHNNREMAEKTLIESLRVKGFSYSDVMGLAAGFNYMKKFHSHLVMATTIMWALSESDVMIKLYDMYRDSLVKNSENPPGPDLPF